MAKRYWQHMVPQEQTHEIISEVRKGKDKVTMICSSCKKRIRLVDENEGPEGLKAMFRF